MESGSDSNLTGLLSKLSLDLLDPRLDRDRLLSRLVDSALELTASDRASVFLANSETGRKLTSMVATGAGNKTLEVESDKGIVGQVFRSGLPLMVNNVNESPYFFPGIDKSTSYETHTVICAPLRSPDGQNLGVIEALNSKRGKFERRDLDLLQILALFAAIALTQKGLVESLQTTLRKERWNKTDGEGAIVLNSKSRQMQEVFEKIPLFADSNVSVLIEGESGTGKEVIARWIHQKSKRCDMPFIAVNCAAIPETLFEAELFGVAKGAATGTIARRGKIELADKGTLFLDEVGELPLSLQPKLLRVLQDKKVARVGSEGEPVDVDFRIVAATNQNLKQLVQAGQFREDLYFRLEVMRLQLSPLRERLEDLEELCDSIFRAFEKEHGWKKKPLTKEALKDLKGYSWPGNLRELRNKLESAYILSGSAKNLDGRLFNFSGSISPGVSHEASKPAPLHQGLSLRQAKNQFQTQLIQDALVKTGGNKSRAAKLLGITRQGLIKALAKAG